jgi:lipopolysaccharide export LptBFGC system permease protein LptF
VSDGFISREINSLPKFKDGDSLSIIHRYIFSSILKTFVVCFLLMLFIFSLGAAFRLLRADVSGVQFFRMLPVAVLYTLPYILPVNLLVAVSLTYGRLVANQELLAMKASGISPLQIMLPGFLPGLLLTLLTVPLEASLLPTLHWQQSRLAGAVIEEFLSLGKGQHKSFRRDSDKINLYIRSFENGSLEGVILRRKEEARDIKIVAERGQLEVDKAKHSLILNLNNVSLVVYNKSREGILLEHSRGRFKKLKQEIPLRSSATMSPKDLSTFQLTRYYEKLLALRVQYGVHGFLYGSTTYALNDARVRATVHLRAVTPCASLIFVLIGIPIALLLSSENYLIPFFISFLAVTIFYFIPFTVGKSMAGKGQEHVLWLWLGPVIGLCAGIILSFWASRR